MEFVVVGIAAANVCKLCSLLVISGWFGGSNGTSSGVRVHSFSKSHDNSAKTGNAKVDVAMVTY